MNVSVSASVNLESIEAKLQAWAKSSEGKKRIAQTLKSYREGKNPHVNSTGKTIGGSEIITYDQMQAAAKDLISMLRKHAASAGLPASVLSHIESFTDSAVVVREDGGGMIEINMLDDASRASLQPENYEGAYNIVALFNHGWNAPGAVKGVWATTGEEVWSRKTRAGSYFVQATVSEFLAKYGSKYNVTATISGEYQ